MSKRKSGSRPIQDYFKKPALTLDSTESLEAKELTVEKQDDIAYDAIAADSRPLLQTELVAADTKPCHITDIDSLPVYTSSGRRWFYRKSNSESMLCN